MQIDNYTKSLENNNMSFSHLNKIVLPVLAVCIMVPILLTVNNRGFYSDDFYYLSRAAHHDISYSFNDSLRMTGGMRPLGHLLAALQYELLGANSLSHQLWMATLHFFSAFCVFLFIRSFFRHRFIGLFASATFAVIPWHLQTIFWPICDMNIVSSSLILLSAWLFLGYVRDCDHKVRCFVLSLFCYVLAILFHEQSLSWLVVWPLLAWAADERKNFRQSLLCSWHYILSAVLLGGFLVIFSTGTQPQSQPDTGLVHIVTSSIMLLGKTLKIHIYLTLAGLRSYHLPVLKEWWHIDIWKIFTLFFAIIVVWIIFVKNVWRDRISMYVPEHFWRCILMGGVMFIAPIGILALAASPYVEHRHQYFTSIGFVFILSCGCYGILPKLTGNLSRALFTILICSIITVFAVCTATRSQEWVESWRIQKNVITSLQHLIPFPPERTIIIIDDFPPKIGFSAYTYGNESCLLTFVSKAYNRKDLRAHSRFWIDEENGKKFAGIGTHYTTDEVGDRPILFFRYIPGKKKLVQETEYSYRTRHTGFQD